jgi:hypothetical protein
VAENHSSNFRSTGGRNAARNVATEEAEQKDKQTAAKNRRTLERQINLLEQHIEELRVRYEQFFIDVLPFAPEKEQQEVVREMREILRAPFKNSADRFRIRSLISRFQTYKTYWSRVLREREEGRFQKDRFKAELHSRLEHEAKHADTLQGKTERGMQQLFSAFEGAMKKIAQEKGANDKGKTEALNYEAFRRSLLERTRDLKKKHGISKVQYRIVVKDGRVVVKASAKS